MVSASEFELDSVLLSQVLSCNRDGMEALRKGQSKAAFEQFKYAEAILIANSAESGAPHALFIDAY